MMFPPERIGEIRRAIAGRGISTVFQPIVDLQTGVPAGYEALSRFTAGGTSSPLEWFEDAHRLGLGLALELRAIRGAIGASGFDRGRVRQFLSVNASPSVIESPDFVAAIRGCDLGRLVVEITEQAPIPDHEMFRRHFRRLRVRRVRLAIDDSGAGHGSLRRIVELAPDLIKLDMELTRGIHADPVRAAMVAAMVQFGHETGARVVTEGVENEAELRTVRSLGADYAQGYHLGRPAALPNATRVAAAPAVGARH